jgi:hypothetical protein
MTSNVEKKLREAQFFLDKMRKQEERAFGDKEQFDFYLSAFLNAVRTVDYRLCHEQAAYPAWRKTWNANHSREDDRIKFVSDERALEVHRSGSARIAQAREIKLFPGSSYSDASGKLEVFGSPAPLIAGSDAGGILYVPRYVYAIDETERPVIEVCAEALEALKQMVTEYKVFGHP